MLTIRKSQIAALEDSLWDSFAGRLAETLATENPNEAAAMDDIARTAVAKGREYGMAIESSFFSLAGLMVLWGRDFDTTLDWARRIASWTDVAGDHLAVLLQDHSDTLRTSGKATRPK